MKPVIAVAGAAGQTGLAAIATLAARGASARALIHRDEQAEAALGAGASETVTIDLDDPGSLAPALEGIEAVLHIPPVFTPQEPEQVQGMLDAARASGVERFVFHSVMQPSTPGLRHHERKARSEAAVRRSGLRWTILQPAMYAHTVTVFWGRSPSDRIVIPYSLDSPFTPIALTDLANVTATVLLEDDHDFATYELGGPGPRTAREMIALICETTGDTRPVQRGDLASLALPETWTESQREDMAAMCAHYDEFGLVGGHRVLEMLLGAPGTSFEQAVLPTLR
jgi:uncharacterized protein YbjT (DUF2867 family)